MQKLSNSFLIASGIKKMILDQFGATTAWGNPWDLDKFVKAIQEDKSVDEEFDIYELSEDEMILLGFGTINGKPYKTIPAWLYCFLPDELAVIPEGETEYKTMNKTDFNPQLIYGCFTYGIIPRDKINKKDEIIK